MEWKVERFSDFDQTKGDRGGEWTSPLPVAWHRMKKDILEHRCKGRLLGVADDNKRGFIRVACVACGRVWETTLGDLKHNVFKTLADKTYEDDREILVTSESRRMWVVKINREWSQEDRMAASQCEGKEATT